MKRNRNRNRGGGGVATPRGASIGVVDNFNRANGALGTRSDGGSWTLVNGTAPVISSNALVAGAAGGDIIADLTYQNATYSMTVTTTVGTFNPIMRILSDGSATTNYLGVAIDNANGAFSATFYMHSGGTFTSGTESSGPVFTSGTPATVAVVITGAPGAPVATLKVNGTTVATQTGGSALNTIAGNAGATKCGIMVPGSGATFDNYNAA